MILESLQQVDLKDYKFYFIGPIEDNFKPKIEEFYINNPIKKESVKFLGAINDRKELIDYYKKSKLFILSSKVESFGLVLTEALFFNNYLLSTNVGCAKDLIREGIGELFENSNELSLKIEKFINSEVIIDNNKIYDLISSYDYEQIVNNFKLLKQL